LDKRSRFNTGRVR